MIYQFLDWRLGRGRKLLHLNVEACLDSVRAVSDNALPMILTTWEQLLAFAGAAGIKLPERENVARHIQPSESYPSVKWVQAEYGKLLVHLAAGPNSNLLLDPEPPAPEVVPVTFNRVVEGSVSNVEDREGVTCSVPGQATSPPTSTLTGSPSSLSTGTRLSPSQLRTSTPIVVPSNLLGRQKDASPRR